MPISLDDQRRFGNRILTALLWAFSPLLLAISLVFHGRGLLAAGIAAALATAATLLVRLDPDGRVARPAVGVALMGQVSLLVGAYGGHPWQIDMHMAYFAALAVLMLYWDWRAILAAAGAVALHHLIVSFLLPAAVFPNGGDVGRVLVHAVILSVEAGILMGASVRAVRMYETSASALARAEEARQIAERAIGDAERAHMAEARASSERQSLETAVGEARRGVVEGLAAGLGHMARGDLTFRLETPFAEEFEALRADFNAAAQRLESTLSGIVGSAEGMRANAGEISRAAQDLARRTEHQAANLAETAGSLDEITARVRTTADSARQVAELVANTREGAARSGAVVRDAVAAMGEIENSATQISQIIGVIDEIAFQTNLLALNAGVEAARAGDAGRGFAVVASEVRALAQRSAEAAKEIKALILASTSRVAEGVKLVGDTGGSLEGIMDEVARISGLVADIAASAHEQASGLVQLNEAVGEMDRVTQQNAAMVEETTAASQSMATSARALAESVAQFSVREGAASAPARRQAA